MLQAILESAVDAIVIVDDHGLVETVNTASEKMFLYDRAELIGRNVTMLMPLPYRSEHDEYVRRYRETREARIIGIGRQLTGQRKDGTTFPIHLSVGEFEADGACFYTGFIHDLTDRQQSERALEH
ncbi:MAG: PAS domain S-box protein, partial [Rhizobiales bacterium]|nr:PAS domain S-box protein [Hyphomicrobiales bacterium]